MTAILIAPGGSVRVKDSDNHELDIQPDGSINVNVTAPITLGSEVEVKNDSGNPVPVDTGLTQPTTPADTQPVSAASLPLPSGAAEEATLQLILSGLAVISAELIQKYEGGAIALDAPTLAALETINAVQSGTWTVGLDAASLSALETIQAAQSGTWTVELSSAVLTALETINAVQSGAWEVSLSAASLAALETINAVVSATDLDIRNLAFATDKVDASGSVLGPGTNNIGDVDLVHFLDAGNSTTVAADFTGTPIDVTQYEGVQVICFADVSAGATVTVRAQWSYDGTDWLSEVLGANVTAGADLTLMERRPHFGQFFRVTVTITGGTYTKLRVQTIHLPVAAQNRIFLGEGTNTIGKLAANPGVDIGSVDILVGRTDGHNGVIKDNNGVDCTVKVAHLDMTTATTTDIVPVVAGKRIRVLAYTIVYQEIATTLVNFARGAGTTRVTGSPVHTSAAGTGILKDDSARVATPNSFLFETGEGEALRVTNSAAVDISVAVTYIEVL